MGCSPSKSEVEEEDTPVKICRDRRDFVKQAVKQRSKLGFGLVAYLESLARVSAALREFVDACDGNGHAPLLTDAYEVCPSSPVKMWLRQDGGGTLDGYAGGRYRDIPLFGTSSSEQHHPLQQDGNGTRLPDMSSAAAATNSVQTTSPDNLFSSADQCRCSPDTYSPHTYRATEQIVSQLRMWPRSRQHVELGEVPTTPSYTAYMERRASSIPEATAEVAYQFERIQDSAEEMKELLEVTSGRQNRYTAFIRSGSSTPGASSTRLLLDSPDAAGSRAEGEGGSGEEDSSEEGTTTTTNLVLVPTASHRATLNRLYTWERKLYEEVKVEDEVGREYDKRWMQLHQHDEMGADAFTIDRTRKAIRDLHSQVKMSLRAIQAISARIEALRDDELHPQIIQLILGLRRMWAAMAECHRAQICVVEDAKLLLDAPPEHLPPPPAAGALSFSASKLQSEIRNWRARLDEWLTAHRAYAKALAGWARRCAPATADADSQQGEEDCHTPPIVATCIEWAGFLEPAEIVDARASEVLLAFAAGVGSLVVGRKREGRRAAWRRQAEVEMVELVDDEATERALRTVFTGLGATVESLAELAGCYRDGYRELAGKCEDAGRTSE